MAVKEHGLESVHHRIGREPSGQIFNKLTLKDVRFDDSSARCMSVVANNGFSKVRFFHEYGFCSVQHTRTNESRAFASINSVTRSVTRVTHPRRSDLSVLRKIRLKLLKIHQKILSYNTFYALSWSFLDMSPKNCPLAWLAHV